MAGLLGLLVSTLVAGGAAAAARPRPFAGPEDSVRPAAASATPSAAWPGSTVPALASPQSVPVEGVTSANWSGYVLTGGHYSGVEGTFTVPALRSYVAGSTNCQWVGIDGYGDSSVVQAGVSEVPEGPGQVVVQPWWEAFPGPQIPILTVTVHTGDKVSVAVEKTGAGEWAISLKDQTNGEVFAGDESYSGPARSTEWVVEAELQRSDSRPAPTPLAPYGPAVVFTDIGAGVAQPAQTTLSRLTMVQDGRRVSTPSVLGGGAFSVVSGGAAPSGPAVS